MYFTMIDKIEIWIDGSYYVEHNKGGVGILMRFNEDWELKYSLGPYFNTNSLEMEIRALEEAVKLVEVDVPIFIYTDNLYVVDGINGNKKGKRWMRSKYKSKIEAIKSLFTSFYNPIQVSWVKGHAGNYGNEEVDHLAKTAALK